MTEDWCWQPVALELRSTEAYRRLMKMETPDSTWHALSPPAGRSRVVCITVEAPEDGCLIDLLHLGGRENNELAQPSPLELFNPLAVGASLPLIAPDTMIVIGLTGKARAVRVGLSVLVPSAARKAMPCP